MATVEAGALAMLMGAGRKSTILSLTADQSLQARQGIITPNDLIACRRGECLASHTDRIIQPTLRHPQRLDFADLNVSEYLLRFYKTVPPRLRRGERTVAQSDILIFGRDTVPAMEPEL